MHRECVSVVFNVSIILHCKVHVTVASWWETLRFISGVGVRRRKQSCWWSVVKPAANLLSLYFVAVNWTGTELLWGCRGNKMSVLQSKLNSCQYFSTCLI